jgi:hypothetical protein
MQVDESSVNSSYGNPQFIRNGEIIYGLVRLIIRELQGSYFFFFQHVDTKQLPSLNSLLGRYAWIETGIESPCGPQLNEGMTLKLQKDPTGQLVQGELTLLGQTGMITAVRSSDFKGGEDEDDAPCWEFDLTWENQHPSFPDKASVYVGTVLDDNNAPFLEVVFRDKKDYRSPYGYAKRQADEGDAVGLSDAEKERLNFLMVADYNAVMDTKEAEERKSFDERLLKKRLEEEERERQEKERQRIIAEEKHKNRNSRANQQEASRKRRQEQAGMTKKQRKAANRKLQEEQQAASRERKKAADDARMVTSQSAGKDQKSLMKEEAKFDLLKNMANTASSSGTTAQPPQVTLPSQRLQAPADLKGFPNPIVKQEEIPPSLRPAVHHGIKRSHPDDPEDKDSKRVKLEY